MTAITIHTDASLPEHRQWFGVGAVVLNGEREIAVLSARIACPNWWTSTLAERHAALEALVHVAEHVGVEIDVLLRVDDRSVEGALKREPTLPREGLAPADSALAGYTTRLRAAASVFTSCRAKWIPRERNRRANDLAAWASTEQPRAGHRPHHLVALDNRVLSAGDLCPIPGAWAHAGTNTLQLPSRG